MSVWQPALPCGKKNEKKQKEGLTKYHKHDILLHVAGREGGAHSSSACMGA
jgi:hypothetical protein